MDRFNKDKQGKVNINFKNSSSKKSLSQVNFQDQEALRRYIIDSKIKLREQTLDSPQRHEKSPAAHLLRHLENPSLGHYD